MATSQQLQSLASGLQQNIQEGLPVVPNNGNPGGAHNMVASTEPVQVPAAAPDPLAWLKPSQYMDNINNLLHRQMEDAVRRVESERSSQGKFNIGVLEGQPVIMPLTNDGVPLSGEIPVAPMRTMEEVNTNPDAPIIPMYMNPGYGT